MRLEFTVRVGDAEHDVVLRSPREMTLREILPQLLAATGAADDLRPVGVALDHAVGQAPLAHAGVLDLARDARARAEPEPCSDLTLDVIGGAEAGRCVALIGEPMRIGRDPTCSLVLADTRVSRIHASVRATAAGVVVQDHGSTNGTLVEGTPLAPGPHALALDDVVRIGDTLLTVRAARAVCLPEDPAPAPVIDFGPAPGALSARRVQWLAAALPALAGGGLAWATGSVMFLLFAVLSPVMMLATAFGDRLEHRRTNRGAAESRRARCAALDRQLEQALRTEVVQRRARHPDPPALARLVAPGSADPRVGVPCSRRPVDGDRSTKYRRDDMVVRLGSSDQPSLTRLRRDGAEQPAATLPLVPLLADLRDVPLVLLGTPADVDGAARAILVQLVARHPPERLELALFLDGHATQLRWSWARWLPHLGHRVAAHREQWPTLAAELTDDRRAPPVEDRADTLPRTLVVVDGWHDELAEMFACPHVTGLVLAGPDAPPSPLGRRLELSPAPGDPVVHDRVSVPRAGDIARRLGASSAPANEQRVPATCHLLDVLSPDGLDERCVVEAWSSCDGGAGTLLGQASTGPVEVDLARDGPHALVAGTTGAGKSELLRSWVLGLALRHPPRSLNFLLIDFKGGAAFSGCAQLPHVAGTVTDLDPQLTRRALTSLEVELRRRESLFAQASAVDLAGYRACGGEPVARLVIVVDEFAALADELPELLRGLVSIAQRGRSLGVHLVLATQRPGTAVTADIRANTALRIALRVVDRLESHEIIGTPQAASISARTRGRALLASDEHVVEFQAAAIGGVPREARPDISVELLGPWRTPTGRTAPQSSADSCRAIVRTIQHAARESGQPTARALWADPLPAVFHAPSPSVDRPWRVPFGLLDRPATREQDLLIADLADPTSSSVIGAPGTGRTNALRRVAIGAADACAPDELHLHVIDAAGDLVRSLRTLPHVRTCLGPDELDAAPVLLRMLAAPSSDRARILLLIDELDRLADDGIGPVVGAELTALLRTRRVSVMLTGGRALLMSRLIGEVAHRFVLRLDDRADYALAGVAARDVPADLLPGRGVRVSDGASLQLAFVQRPPRGSHDDSPCSPEDEILARWRDAPRLGGVRVRPLPSRVELAELQSAPDALRIGLAGDGADAVHLLLSAEPCRLLVAGRRRSGRTSTLVTLLSEAHRLGVPIVVAAEPESALWSHAVELGITPVDPAHGGTPALRSDRTVVLVDDAERLAHTAIDATLAGWAGRGAGPTIIASTELETVALAYRGLIPELRRGGNALLLNPSASDLASFGVTVPPGTGPSGMQRPPGRGVFCGSLNWLVGPPRLRDQTLSISSLVVQIAKPPPVRQDS